MHPIQRLVAFTRVDCCCFLSANQSGTTVRGSICSLASEVGYFESVQNGIKTTELSYLNEKQ